MSKTSWRSPDAYLDLCCFSNNTLSDVSLPTARQGLGTVDSSPPYQDNGWTRHRAQRGIGACPFLGLIQSVPLITFFTPPSTEQFIRVTVKHEQLGLRALLAGAVTRFENEAKLLVNARMDSLSSF